ncbi:probable WRKY transcription factor 65 isoform X2 [Aristolochia californica]|uniref:probable WRKY transcription factor 65 isoform X2 n=1 Tax=Aristolochia californica TaxID=171875 RepID=UPI0035DFC90A
MDGRFSSPFVGEREEPASTPESNRAAASTFSGGVADGKLNAISSPKRRRAVQKRVVSVPIAEVEGSRLKGEGAPPSDSWAWRKYGQKPIKGSPYPRGYYRCSSSKGCPARKQVERSRVDPKMLVVTYACEHNHPWPTSRNNSTSSSSAAAALAAAPSTPSPAPQFPPEEPAVFSKDIEPEEKFPDLTDDTLISDDFTWFSDVSSSPGKEAVFQSPICGGSHISGDADVAAIMFPMGEEDESLFADLGELPECSLVFRRGLCEGKESLRTAPWCGSTG